jgi:hypothetical protein
MVNPIGTPSIWHPHYNPGNIFDEAMRTLAICSGSVENKHGLLTSVPAHRPPGGGLEEGDQISLVVHDLPDKLFPHGAIGVFVIADFGEFGNHVLFPVGQQFSGVEVNRAVLHVEEPGVFIQVVNRGVKARDILRRPYRGLSKLLTQHFKSLMDSCGL